MTPSTAYGKVIKSTVEPSEVPPFWCFPVRRKSPMTERPLTQHATSTREQAENGLLCRNAANVNANTTMNINPRAMAVIRFITTAPVSRGMFWKQYGIEIPPVKQRKPRPRKKKKPKKE